MRVINFIANIMILGIVIWIVCIVALALFVSNIPKSEGAKEYERHENAYMAPTPQPPSSFPAYVGPSTQSTQLPYAPQDRFGPNPYNIPVPPPPPTY